MNSNSTPSLVSIHGGHSGEFCNHAQDSLEDIIREYINQGVSWVGITEHMAPVNDEFLYDDEVDAGFDAARLQDRFREYFRRGAGLREKYRDKIDILVGFETETYEGSEALVREWIIGFAPDYIVGSLHHVNNRCIDVSQESYLELADSLGGLDELYCQYFDEQYAMLKALKPSVVGHFDLVRIFDPDYKERLRNPDIWGRVVRNLDFIKDKDLILDLNLRGFDKPGKEQYPTRDILSAAIEKGIAIVPGDDSHGINDVGRNFERGVALLEVLGGNLEWRRPVT